MITSSPTRGGVRLWIDAQSGRLLRTSHRRQAVVRSIASRTAAKWRKVCARFQHREAARTGVLRGRSSGRFAIAAAVTGQVTIPRPVPEVYAPQSNCCEWISMLQMPRTRALQRPSSRPSGGLRCGASANSLPLARSLDGVRSTSGKTASGPIGMATFAPSQLQRATHRLDFRGQASSVLLLHAETRRTHSRRITS